MLSIIKFGEWFLRWKAHPVAGRGMDLIGRLKKAGQWCYSQKQESVRNFGLFGSRPVSEDGKVGDKAITRQTAQDGTEVTSGID